MDRWTSKVVPCTGGLILNLDALTQGTQFPGSARILQNYEPSLDGGYRRLSGTIKFDSTVIPGDANAPVLGLKVALGGVFGCRKLTGDNKIYFGTGSGWTLVSTTARNGSPTKARFIAYSITEPVVIQCDGVNAAWKWDGATETTINGVGAPTNPKFASLWRNRLALSGYGDGSKVSLSAPDDDANFDGGDGAVEINVGDTVTGLKTFRDELIIFCSNSIKKLVGNTTDDFSLEEVVKSIGCVSGDTIQEIGGDLVFLGTDTIRSYAATERINDVEISSVSVNIQPLVSEILSQNFEEDIYSSCCIRQKSQYRLFLNDPNLPEVDTMGLLSRVQDTPSAPHGNFEWATLNGLKPYCADSEYTDNQEISIIGHPTSGYVYRLESGNTFDGTNLVCIYRSPDLTFDDASVRKVFHKIDIFSQTEGDIEFNLNLLLDRSVTGTIQPSTITITQSGTAAIYGAAIYNSAEYGEFALPLFKKNLIGSGFFGAFQFSSNNDKAPHRIDSYQVQIAIKGRR